MSPAPDSPKNPAFPRPRRLDAHALLTEAEALAGAVIELAPAAPLACADPACGAPARHDSVRVVMQEVHFTCGRGHWNALGSSCWQEAA